MQGQFFKLLKPAQVDMLDKVLFGVGGAALLLPTLVAPVTGFALGPVSVQMLAGALMAARLVDSFMK